VFDFLTCTLFHCRVPVPLRLMLTRFNPLQTCTKKQSSFNLATNNIVPL